MMFMITMNLLFMMLSHPMSMGLILIIQTIIVAINTGILMKTFWLSYILVITMLSGMLVLFVYMSSIASNEKFKTKTWMWVGFLFMMAVSLMFLFLSKKMIIKNNYLGMEMLSMSPKMIFMNKMFNSNNMYITLMLVVYLLMTMIVSSFLVNIVEGPLRLKI